MESKKSKIFSRKLIALFLAALMVISTFTGVMSVFAKSTEDYHDENLAANFLAWAETTDNQTAEALLDYADLYLPQIMEGLDLGDIKPRGSTRINFSYDVPVIGTIKLQGYVDSIDGVLDLVRYIQENILNGKFMGRSYKNWIGGDVDNIDFSAIYDLETSTSEGVVSKCGVAYRSQNDAKDVIICVAKLIYNLSNDWSGSNVINNFIKGSLDLGLVGSFLNIWDLLKDPLNMWDNYQTNLVYNIVANLIWQNTDWYSEAEVTAFKEGANGFINKGKDQTVWDFDNELFGKLTSELVQLINIQVTYPNKVEQIELDPTNEKYGQVLTDDNGNPYYTKDSSKRRWFYIYQYMQQGKTYAEAVAAVNENEGAQQGFWCDPNLRYSMNEGGTSDGNILLFTYGDNTLTVEKTDTMTDIAFRALEIAWQTVLQPTVTLLKPGYEGNRNNSTVFNQEVSDFDNEFYSWVSNNIGWNDENWVSNYSAENVNAWATAVYKNYQYKDGVEASVESFLDGVSQTFKFDRKRVSDPQNNWRDVDATKLFAELRYSPLADKYFNQQTGPVNLYFVQTGAPNIKAFFNTAFEDYDSILKAVNNGLVAAIKDFFPNSSNIGVEKEDGTVQNIELPTLTETTSMESGVIASTIVGNAAKVFEYAANSVDANILGAFYANNGITNISASNNISEANIEEAALPMLISILNQWNITDVIHDAEWDTCVDAEGVAVTALAEYLSYVIPDKDYSDLYGVVNGKLVPTYDVDGKNGITWLEDVIMPMARDAVGYLLQSVVPCRKTDGTEWSVYTSNPKTDQTTIFDLLNSVLCYYGSTDTFSNDHGSGANTIKGKGAAALLGCVDSNGKCTITFENSIWKNIDTIANTVFPIVGALQKGTWGAQADSYDLIYTKFIQGALNIGDNGGGITNIIKQLADIIKSEPLNTGADIALYDYIVAPTANAIFGGKYSGQGFATVIPASHTYFDSDSSSNTKGESPFNALIHVDTLGGYGDGTGVLCVLICNLIEAFGVNDYKSMSGDRWQGAMFAVKAVNNFIPSFVPQLSDMKFGPVTANMETSTYAGMTRNQPIKTSLTITNTALGLNRFYRESATGDVQREKRYFAEIKDVSIVNDDGVGGINLQQTELGVLAPGESVKIPVNGAAPSRDKTYIYKAQVTYNMFEGELANGNKPTANGNYMFSSDITTTAYLTITVGGSWHSAVYPYNKAEKDGDNVTKYKYGSTNNTAGRILGSGDNIIRNTAVGGQDNALIAAVPDNMVISSDDPSIVNKYSIRVRNNGSSTYSYSGIVAFVADGTEYYPVNGTTVSDTLATISGNTTTNMAYALIDEEGNLLNKEMYDYRIKNTDGTYGAWQRGYTRTALDNMEKEGGSLYTAFNDHRVEERASVAYTFAEACAAGIVKGVQKNANGTYKNVFVTPSPALLASESAAAITWAAPFDGYYFVNHGASIAASSDTYDYFLEYDGNGVTPSKEATVMNLCFVTPSGNYMTSTTNVYVADASDLYSLSSAINEEVTKMASYRPSDFRDFDEETGVSESYNAIIKAMTSALDLAATPLSVASAAKVSSTKVLAAKTSETGSETGDKAYKPATADQIPADVRKGTYNNGNYYFLDKDFTVPIYSNDPLTDADVVNGMDATGQAVKKVNGVYYLANDTNYNYEWDTETYWVDTEIEGEKAGAPYYGPVEDADHINQNNPYKQKQFVYRDIYGNKVNSDDRYDNGDYKWVVKFADTETVIKPNDENDYRGAYQQGIDTINYYNSIFSQILKTVGAQSVAEEVSAVRSVDSNSVNYDVAIYEKMVMVAREAESLIWYEDAKDSEGNYILNADGSRKQTPVTDKSSMEIEVAVNRFKDYYARAQANSRGYIGGRLEAEISAHHAIGGTYEDFEATKTGEQVRFEYSTKAENEEDNVDVYTIKVADGTNIGFGARDAEGNLVNEDENGNKAWTDASWNAYVNALGAAVETATEQTAKVSEVYTAKSHLVMAENNLQPYTGEEGEDTNKFTVSGMITIAKNSQGSAGEYGIGGIEIYMGDQLVGTSAEDGTFEIKVPKGEPVGLTLKGESTVERSITINGDADVTDINIPVVVVDYLKDGIIDYRDVKKFVNYIDEPEAYNVYGDLLKDGLVDYRDVKIFVNFIDVPVEYASWSQTDTTYILN